MSKASPLVGARPRLDWLDELKAIAILFVIGGHLCFNGIYPYAAITSHIKLPIFYAVSGFLFSKSKLGKPLDFIKNKLLRLMLPYFILTILMDFFEKLTALIGGKMSILELLALIGRDLLTGQHILWFIPSLFLCELLLFAIMRITKTRAKPLLAIALIFIAISYPASKLVPVLPWQINAVFTILPFLIFGFLYKQIFDKITKKQKALLGTACTLGYFGIIAAFFVFKKMWLFVNIYNNYYPIFFVSLLLMHLGTAAAMLLAPLLPTPKLFSVLGRNTLFYYAFHMPAATNGAILLSLIWPGHDLSFLKANRIEFLIFVIAILILLVPFCYFTNKAAPFAVGKKSVETGAVWLKLKKK